MRSHNLDNVGDEPIYCETQHDDVLYSGSEDDYYEAPEHRRLRVEAKAVQFLNGNVPYLLSAKLKGPFDAKSWNNPWRSKRAQHHAVQIETQSGPSMMTVEAAKDHDSGRAIHNLPNTQTTSLYPLPSPEITNPPSARKNLYMAEEQYSRIKTWRAAVKKIPISTDSFWTSRKDESQRSTATTKRSADQDWLRKRESKKRKSEDLRKLALDESPSQAAAKTRRNLLPGRLAEIVMQSAPGSTTHEDELAAYWGPHTAGFGASRMAPMPTNTPGVLQAARRPQSSTSYLLAQDPESSQDELSVPSITPSRNASRSPPKKFQSSTPDHTPSRRKKKESDEVPRTRGCVGDARLDSHIDVTLSSRPVLGRASRTSSQRSQTTSDSPLQTVRPNIGKAALDANEMHIPMSQGCVQDNATKLAVDALLRAVGASQQDNSFYFHQLVAKSRSPSKDQIHRMTRSALSSQRDIPELAIERLCQKDDQPRAEDDGLYVPAPSHDQMDVDPSDYQNPPLEVATMASISADDAKMAGTAVPKTPTTQPQVNEPIPLVVNRPEEELEVLGYTQPERPQIGTNAEPDLSTHTCTQELSPISMQDNSQVNVASITAAENPHPKTCLIFDDVKTSNPEWSTYISTQDPSTPFERPASLIGVTKEFDSVLQGADDFDDRDWTTYIHTQDIKSPSIEDVTGSKGIDGIPVVEQGPDETSDPDWSTIIKSQDQFTVEAHCDEVAVVGDGRVVDPGSSDRKVTESAADDAESNSTHSSYSGSSSHVDANQKCNASNKPVLAEAPAPESRFSQVTLEAIVDAYAESDESHDEFEDCPESQLSIGDRQGPDAAFQCEDDRGTQETESGRQEDTAVPTEDPHEPPVPVAPMEQDEQPVGREEAPAFHFDGTLATFESLTPPVGKAPLQSPWAKEDKDIFMPVIPSSDTKSCESTLKLSSLAGQALAFSPEPRIQWTGGQFASQVFSLSVKRFSDFMKPSPSKKRASADGSILRNSNSTSRVLFGSTTPVKPKRRVTFAPLPDEKDAALTAAGLKDNEVYVEEDLSYFDAKGNKTASIHITRSQTRAASPPPSEMSTVDADELPDHDHKFAKHFEAISKRREAPPRKTQRLLPSESQQTNGSQAIDAMAEAFIQASQMGKQSSELVEAIDANSQLVQSSSEKTNSLTVVHSIEQQENIDPVDDVSAVLDNIDDFLDNSWGFDTSLNVDTKRESPAKQQAETVPSRFANVGDPMLAMHANVWAD